MATEINDYEDLLENSDKTAELILEKDISPLVSKYGVQDGSLFADFKAKLNGNGHSISNLILNNVSNMIPSSDIFKNIIFREVTLFTIENKQCCFFQSRQMTSNISDTASLYKVKFSAYIKDNSQLFSMSQPYNSYSYPSIYRCAFDFTFSNNKDFTLGPSKTRISQSNIVLRNVVLDPSAFAPYTTLSTIIVKNPKFFQEDQVMSLNGNNSIYIFEAPDMTDEVNISISGDPSCLFCNNSNGKIHATITGIQEISPENLKSESYLRSIGFMP